MLERKRKALPLVLVLWQDRGTQDMSKQEPIDLVLLEKTLRHTSAVAIIVAGLLVLAAVSIGLALFWPLNVKGN